MSIKKSKGAVSVSHDSDLVPSNEVIPELNDSKIVQAIEVVVEAKSESVLDTDHVKTDGKVVSDVLIYRTGSASKLSLRASGVLTYQLGYVVSLNQLFVRIQLNDTGGYFSKEWVPIVEVESILLAYASEGSSFSAAILKGCFVSRSQNNAGFLAAIIKSEGLIHTLSGKSNLLVFDEGLYQAWITQQFILANDYKDAMGSDSTALPDESMLKKSPNPRQSKAKATKSSTADLACSGGNKDSLPAGGDKSMPLEEEAAILDAVSS